jgi:hypothetical protein
MLKTNLYELTNLRILVPLSRSRLNMITGSTKGTYNEEEGNRGTPDSDPIEADARKDDRASNDTS